MSAAIAEKPPSALLDAAPIPPLPKKEEEISRLPLAAGLLPYGLSLASLLQR